MTRAARLIVDLGGTNARFALAVEAVPPAGEAIVRLPLAGYAGLLPALADFLEGPGQGVRITSAAIAAAGPVEDGTIALTNAPWVIRAGEVAAALGGVPVVLMNDLEAVAHALPALGADDTETLAPGVAPARPLPRLALNIGTGFGAALAVPLPDGGWHALATEAGHMRFGAVGAAEQALLAMVETVEDLVSGRGIAALHSRLAGLAGGPAAAEVLARAEAGEPLAGAVRDLMLGALGRIAGDLVLATGAWGGVWLCGGVVAAWRPGWTDAVLPGFRAHGPMTERLARVPLRRILHPEPGLLGLARATAGATAGAPASDRG